MRYNMHDADGSPSSASQLFPAFGFQRVALGPGIESVAQSAPVLEDVGVIDFGSIAHQCDEIPTSGV